MTDSTKTKKYEKEFDEIYAKIKTSLLSIKNLDLSGRETYALMQEEIYKHFKGKDMEEIGCILGDFLTTGNFLLALKCMLPEGVEIPVNMDKLCCLGYTVIQRIYAETKIK